MIKIIMSTHVEFEVEDNVFKEHNIDLDNFCTEAENGLREFYENEIDEVAQNIKINVSVKTEQ